MHVAWVIYGSLTQPTGGYIYDRLVVEGLRALGDRVEVVSLPWATGREAAEMDRTVALSRAISEPRSLPWDVVVGDGLCVRELGPAFEQVSGQGARVLLVHHLASWEVEVNDREAIRAIEARAIAASDRLVVTSHASAERLAREHPGRAIDVVVPGSDRLPGRPRIPRKDGTLALLFVGSIIPRKRLSMLLDAIERASDPRLAVTIVGDAGRDPEHARAIAARIDGSPTLRGCVRTLGVVDDDDLAQRMAQADALVLPSSLEGFGMVLAEALQAGLPVIAAGQAARAAGIAESDAVALFDDADGLAQVMTRLLGDPSRLPAMGRAARGTPLRGWSETASSFRNVLTSVAGAVAGAANKPFPAPSRR